MSETELSVDRLPGERRVRLLGTIAAAADGRVGIGWDTYDKGDYDSSYTINAGSYYDKLYAPYLMTESVKIDKDRANVDETTERRIPETRAHEQRLVLAERDLDVLEADASSGN